MERLVDAIKEGEIIRMTENRAREEDLFILRKIDETPVYPSNTATFAKTREEVKPKMGTYDEWKMPKPAAFYKKNNVLNELIDNFHWPVAKARKNKNLTRKQLGELVGASEEDIKTIEMGQLPRDDFVLVNKIEKVLGINLRKEPGKKEINLAELQKMNENKIKEKVADVGKIAGEKKADNKTVAGTGTKVDESKHTVSMFGDIEVIE